MSDKFTLWFRKKIVVNTDPQRRCYDGCNFSEETVLTEWEEIYSSSSKDDLEDSAVRFKRINKNSEYKVIEQGARP
jgi:hypothetical protein